MNIIGITQLYEEINDTMKVGKFDAISQKMRAVDFRSVDLTWAFALLHFSYPARDEIEAWRWFRRELGCEIIERNLDKNGFTAALWDDD